MQRIASILLQVVLFVLPGLSNRKGDSRISALFLVTANLLPLAGVLLLNWSILSIIWVYWFESAIIGFYTVLKMLSADMGGEAWYSILGLTVFKIFITAFFIFHYFAFMGAHGLFLIGGTIWQRKLPPSDMSFIFDNGWRLLNVIIGNPILKNVEIDDLIESPLPVLIALFISHGASFYLHYLKPGLRRTEFIAESMISPYPRIVRMHLTVLLGAFAFIGVSVFLPSWGNAALASFWVLYKVREDLNAHNKQHDRKETAETAPGSVISAGTSSSGAPSAE